MFRTRLLRAVGMVVVAGLLSTLVFAQTGQVEGTIRLKQADGKIVPAPGIQIDIYRTDIKGRYEVKTDKTGHFVRLGLPLQGTYLFVFSGPGAVPTWMNNVRITQMPVVDTTLDAGDGTVLTLEDVQKQIASQKTGGPGAAPPPRSMSPADKAKAEAAQKELEAANKEGKELQESFDNAVKHFNEGVKLKTANNYEGALAEFEQSTKLDPSKNKHFVEIAHRSNAQVAETNYQIGADKFNKKDRTGAKPHFESAVAAINRAIAVASAVTDDPTVNTDLITYYGILEKNARILVENYGEAKLVDDTVKAIAKAETLDATNKNKWGVLKADMFRSAGRTEEAVAAYKAVIAADPLFVDALYGLGLTLIASTERAQIQEGANTLADFVAKAKPEDKRVPIVKDALEGVKNAYKVEAEKPAAPARGRKKP
ncbi:MAG TPA: tetratricopeptide repeat protein [Blastocatellia bacterium]|nr:tetratricopeptide repeat protein [Blastocatellia bacterium]